MQNMILFMLSSVFARECLVCGGGGGWGGGMVYIFRGINYDDVDMLTVLCQPHCHHLQQTDNCRQSATKYTSTAQPRPGWSCWWPTDPQQFPYWEFTWRCGSSDQIYIHWWPPSPDHHHHHPQSEVENKFWSHREPSRANIKYHYQVKVVGGVRLHQRPPETTEHLRQVSQYENFYRYLLLQWQSYWLII